MFNIIYKIKEAVVRFFGDVRIYPGGFVLFGNSSYKIKGPDMREILNLLEPGDALLRRYDSFLGSRLIPGYWSHIGLYVGDNTMIHMLHDGILAEDILTFLRCDHIAVLKPVAQDKVSLDLVLDRAYKYLAVHTEYDFAFDFDLKDDDKMSCTEFLRNCYGDPKFYKRETSKYILPDDFLHSIFKVAWKK